MICNRQTSWIMVTMLLAACSGAPGDRTVRNAVESNLMKGGADQLIAIENFKKVNGFLKDDRTYIADVHYDIVLKESVQEFAQHIDDLPKAKAAGQEAAVTENAQMGGAFAAIGLAFAFGDAKAGARFPKDDKVTLLKTENGWQVADP